MPFVGRIATAKAGLAPGRARKVPVLADTGNNVPVQMGHHGAELRQIDFIRVEYLSLNRFHTKNKTHELHLFGRGKVGHFLDVLLPDNTGIARVVRLGGVNNANLLILPNERFIAGPAQYA